jgi:hypothetical protein
VAVRVFVGIVCIVATATFCVVLVAGAVVAFPGASLDPSSASGPAGSTQLPASMLAVYERAALTCPGLSWALLAAIGTVESSNGTSNLPGVHSGSNYAGAQGPMQFEPTTFAEYDEPVPPGGATPPSPYDPVDSVYAAARLLCANGATDGADIARAVFAYNHSSQYVDEVLSLERELRSSSG